MMKYTQLHIFFCQNLIKNYPYLFYLQQKRQNPKYTRQKIPPHISAANKKIGNFAETKQKKTPTYDVRMV